MNSNNTFVRKKINFLRGKTKEQFTDELVVILKDKVINAYIFGSFFSEKFDSESDIDILIVVDTKVDFLSRPLLFPELLKIDAPMDVIVYTPEELDEKRKEKNGFWKSVFSQMRQII